MESNSLIEDFSIEILTQNKENKDLNSLLKKSKIIIKDLSSKDENEKVIKTINKIKPEEEFSLLSKLEGLIDKTMKKVSNKDRYEDIVPYDYNRVRLNNTDNQDGTDNDTDYINASWIHVSIRLYIRLTYYIIYIYDLLYDLLYKIPNNYSFIATQGPKTKTTEDFWNMIIQNKSFLIIMLCNTTESGRSKCHQYWPMTNEELKLKGKSIKLSKEDKVNQSNFLIRRKFDVVSHEDKGKIKSEVTQIHFQGWPDHGVPEIEESYKDFLEMISIVDDYIGKSPIVVHCSAGIGRTGTFISLYNAILSINSKKDHMNIFEIVRKVKECRRYSVENPNQYKFIYGIVRKYISQLV